jgi:hypothetical protein
MSMRAAGCWTHKCAVSLSPLSSRCDCCFSLFSGSCKVPTSHSIIPVLYNIIISRGCTNGLYKYGHGPARAARLGLVGLPYRNCNCEENSHMASTSTHSRTPFCWNFRAMAVAQNPRRPMPSRYCRSMHQVWCVNLIQILT